MMAFCLPTHQPMPRRDYSSPVRNVVRPAWQMPLDDRRNDDTAREPVDLPPLQNKSQR